MLGDLKTFQDGRPSGRKDSHCLMSQDSLGNKSRIGGVADGEMLKASTYTGKSAFDLRRVDGHVGNTSMGESTKHARVKVELVNSCDGEWKIDILKTEATPPEDLKEELKQIAKEARVNSEKMFGKRVGRGGAAGARTEETSFVESNNDNCSRTQSLDRP